MLRLPAKMYNQLQRKYLLGDVLGRGGMGSVYAATQRSVERRVAVKIPHPELEHDAFVASRFRIEALAGARLAHKHVARVIDFGGGGDDGVPYKRIAGKRLDTLVTESGALDTRVAMEPRHFARGTQPISAFSTEATTRSWLRERTIEAPAADEMDGLVDAIRR